MLVTDFDRSKGNPCELCPVPIIADQACLTCVGCNTRRVHKHCAEYVLGCDYNVNFWCCSNCRDGRPKRSMDPNLSLRTGSTRARKAPDTYQVVDTRNAVSSVANNTRRRNTTPPVVTPSPILSEAFTPATLASSEGSITTESYDSQSSHGNSKQVDTIAKAPSTTKKPRASFSVPPVTVEPSSIITRSRRRLNPDIPLSPELPPEGE